MIPRLLSVRIILASGLTLLGFGATSIGVIYRAQSQLARQAMDSIMSNDSFSLSSLVDTRPDGSFEFEVTPLAMTNFQASQGGEFFRFIDPNSGHVFQESPGSPQLGCGRAAPGRTSRQSVIGDKTYTVLSFVFRPAVEGKSSASQRVEPHWLCLVVGLDELPFRDLVWQTLRPASFMVVLMIVLWLGLLAVIIRILTADLSKLTGALHAADFGATHEFPRLPKAETAEVEAIVEKLEELHSQAAQSYRDMWLFLGRAAHQLKTPVTAIQVSLETLMRRERSKEELLSGLSDVATASGLLTGLTKKLITSSRISYDSRAPLERLDLVFFFADQIAVFRSLAQQRNIDFRIETSDSLEVSASTDLLSEIFWNLIENAIIYSGALPDRRGAVAVSWVAAGDRAEITVSDTGPGLPESVKASLFVPFVRGDERIESGSGLGLSIAKKAAGLLDGDVVLMESGARGTKLQVRIPLA